MLPIDTNYTRLRAGLLYKRTSLPNKKKELINNFLLFLDEQIPLQDVLDYQPFVPIQNLLNPEVEEDNTFLEVLKNYIADQSEEIQGMFDVTYFFPQYV